VVKILMLNPPVPFLAFPNAAPHIGVGYLISYLRDHGVEVDFLNLEVTHPTEAVVPDGYDFYGITAVTPQYFFANLLKDQIVSRGLGRTVIGGAHASILPDDCIRDGFDYVVCGYGEKALLDIVRGAKSPGVVQGELIEDVDALPFPAWEDIFGDYDVSYGNRIAHIFSVRGCPFGCYYCCSPRIYGTKVVYRSIDNVVAEVRFLVERFGIDGLYFFDPTFTLYKDRAIQLALRLKQFGLDWTCQTRVDCVDEEVLQAMKDAGCNQISFGVETGSGEVHSGLGKGTTLDQNVSAIHTAHSVGMRVKTFLMGALPGDNFEALERFKAFMLDVKPESWLFSTFVPLPGTAYWDNPEEFGIEILCRDFRAYYPLGVNARGPINIRSKHLSREGLRELRDDMLNFLRREIPNERVEEAIRKFPQQREILLPYFQGLDLDYVF